MPPKKKGNQGGNGFYMFMETMMAKQGTGIKNMMEAAEVCAPLWAKMSKEEKEVYSSKAKAAKGTAKKFTSLNEDLELVLQQEEDERQKKAMAELNTKRLVALSDEILKEKYFYLMHINKFCTVRQTETDLPAEIAIIRFNLLNGVEDKNVYHTLINPGELPLGYSFDVKKIAAETHKLEYPNEDSELPTMKEVMKDIVKFLSQDTEGFDDPLPPVFVMDRDLKVANKVITAACLENDYDPDILKIYSLQFFFYTLRNEIKADWPTVSQAIVELERDIYDYTMGISCDYHENTDAPLFCSRSIVIRNVYIICDNCCHLLGITLIPGRHVKAGSNVLDDRPISEFSYHSAQAAGPSNYDDSSSKNKDEAASDDCSDMMSAMSFNSAVEEEDTLWTAVQKTKKNKKVLAPPFVNDENSTPQSSQSTYVPLRRPTQISACVMSGQISGQSDPSGGAMEDKQQPDHDVKPKGRGRGRILQETDPGLNN